MVGKLKAELKQNRDFGSRDEEVTLNIVRTAEFMMSELAEVLKPSGLTVTQYNALRILRGAGTGGRTCGEIGERMVTKESDITRLLDRLESRGLIKRERPAENRRVVITTITDEGAALLAGLDAEVLDSNRRLNDGLSKTDQRSLIDMLERIRESK